MDIPAITTASAEGLPMTTAEASRPLESDARVLTGDFAAILGTTSPEQEEGEDRDEDTDEAEGSADALMTLLQQWSGISADLRRLPDANPPSGAGAANPALSEGTTSSGPATDRAGAETTEDVPGTALTDPGGEAVVARTAPVAPDVVATVGSTDGQMANALDMGSNSAVGEVVQRPADTTALATELRLSPDLAPAQSARPVEVAVTRLIADAVVTQRDGVVEIALSPEELGRVTMVIGERDNTLHVAITAERPEIAEMLRRNAAMLADFLTDRDYGGATFEFSQGCQQQSRGEDGLGGPVPDLDASPVSLALPLSVLPPAATLGVGRLDIRL